MTDSTNIVLNSVERQIPRMSPWISRKTDYDILNKIVLIFGIETWIVAIIVNHSTVLGVRGYWDLDMEIGNHYTAMQCILILL